MGRSYVFYPVTPSTSGRCRGGKERPARPPPTSSHESHVLDNAPAAAKSPPPPPNLGPQVSAAAASFPRKRGWQRSPGSCPAGWGARKLEGTGEWEGGLVTWANLPQGNEVSSRLLGGNGGGRIRPRLSQAGRGISPRSLQPSPLPPPPPGPLLGTGAQRRESAAPLALLQRLGFLSVLASQSPSPAPPPGTPPPSSASVSRNCPPWGGTEGGADVTPWEAGRRPGAGAAEAAAEHAART